MVLPIAIFLTIAIIIGISAGAGFFIKKRQWTNNKKKIVFVLVTSFILFPVFIPAGILAAFPAPNAVLIVAALISGEIFEVPLWYFETAPYSCISYLITSGFMFLISQMVFYERKP